LVYHYWFGSTARTGWFTRFATYTALPVLPLLFTDAFRLVRARVSRGYARLTAFGCGLPVRILVLFTRVLVGFALRTICWITVHAVWLHTRFALVVLPWLRRIAATLPHHCRATLVPVCGSPRATRCGCRLPRVLHFDALLVCGLRTLAVLAGLLWFHTTRFCASCVYYVLHGCTAVTRLRFAFTVVTLRVCLRTPRLRLPLPFATHGLLRLHGYAVCVWMDCTLPCAHPAFTFYAADCGYICRVAQVTLRLHTVCLPRFRGLRSGYVYGLPRIPRLVTLHVTVWFTRFTLRRSRFCGLPAFAFMLLVTLRPATFLPVLCYGYARSAFGFCLVCTLPAVCVAVTVCFTFVRTHVRAAHTVCVWFHGCGYCGWFALRGSFAFGSGSHGTLDGLLPLHAHGLRLRTLVLWLPRVRARLPSVRTRLRLLHTTLPLRLHGCLVHAPLRFLPSVPAHVLLPTRTLVTYRFRAYVRSAVTRLRLDTVHAHVVTVRLRLRTCVTLTLVCRFLRITAVCVYALRYATVWLVTVLPAALLQLPGCLYALRARRVYTYVPFGYYAFRTHARTLVWFYAVVRFTRFTPSRLRLRLHAGLHAHHTHLRWFAWVAGSHFLHAHTVTYARGFTFIACGLPVRIPLPHAFTLIHLLCVTFTVTRAPVTGSGYLVPLPRCHTRALVLDLRLLPVRLRFGYARVYGYAVCGCCALPTGYGVAARPCGFTHTRLRLVRACLVCLVYGWFTRTRDAAVTPRLLVTRLRLRYARCAGFWLDYTVLPHGWLLRVLPVQFTPHLPPPQLLHPAVPHALVATGLVLARTVHLAFTLVHLLTVPRWLVWVFWFRVRAHVCRFARFIPYTRGFAFYGIHLVCVGYCFPHIPRIPGSAHVTLLVGYAYTRSSLVRAFAPVYGSGCGYTLLPLRGLFTNTATVHFPCHVQFHHTFTRFTFVARFATTRTVALFAVTFGSFTFGYALRCCGSTRSRSRFPVYGWFAG